MKFSTKTVLAATALALSSQHATGFSIRPTTPLVSTRSAVTNIRLAPLQATPTTETDVVNDEVQRLQAMAAKLRQEAATLEAQQAEERAQAAERAFSKFDTDQDGELSLDELKAALERTFKMDLPESRVQQLMADFDTSGDGKLQVDEFVSMDQFRNRLEALAQEERRNALDKQKAAQQEEELAKMLEAQLELINDKEPTGTDKIVSVLPYLFPLMDGLMFGSYLLGPNAESNPAVAILALLYTVYRSIPLGGFLAFFALNVLSNNLSLNRLVRFNMQQAIFMDIALIIPGFLAAVTAAVTSGLGVQIPPMIAEYGSDAIFVTLLATIGYATVSSLLGQTPDKIPFLSEAVNNRLPSVDMLDMEALKSGRFEIRDMNEKNNKKDEAQDDNDNIKKD